MAHFRMKKIKRIISIVAVLFVSVCCFENQALETQEKPNEEGTKKVYLTFDDGPIPKITEEILDILEKEEVRATFFVVGKEIHGREKILKRINEEGHTIGLHTYSHKFKDIYRSEEAFIQEMEKTSELIDEVLGKSLNAKIIRFPGGSAGRLNEHFFKALKEKGYSIYDWNVSLEDGVNPNLSPYQIFQNAKKSIDAGGTKIILAHCNSNNKNTCKALPNIIQYYKEQGYQFKAIDEKTPDYYYGYQKTKE